MNFLDIKVNPNSLLFSERERERERESSNSREGGSGGAMVLGKLLVLGRPTNLDNSRARANCACSRCGWGLFGHFSLIYLFSFLSPSLEDGPIQTKVLSQRAIKPKITSQPNPAVSGMRTPVYSCYHVYSKVSDKMHVEV